MPDDKVSRFLSLLFDDGESVCASPDKFAYRSMPVSEIQLGAFELTNNDGDKTKIVSQSDISLIAINPIAGPRCDDGCTAFRTFLVELDDGPLAKQWEYVHHMKMPYSACVFSGGKSLHFAIVLERSLPNLELYRICAEWILSVMSKADPNTKNPSRSIRFPGYMRNGVEQKLLALKSRVSVEDLWAWLSQFEGLRPKTPERKIVTEEPNMGSLPDWVIRKLNDGIDSEKGRNNQWFAIAYEFGLHGFDDDDTIAILEQYFQEDRDFKRKEWEYTVRHAVSRARQVNA